jgi:UDP-N-acetyl-D-galactosamine dehydrogenase
MFRAVELVDAHENRKGNSSMSSEEKLAVIGLGYVGLPLAVALSRVYETIGFDINESRVSDLNNGIDKTLEVEPGDLLGSQLIFTSNIENLRHSTVFIVTVPTPVDSANRPDFGPLVSASRMAGKALKKGDLVVYESTVYPGATEEVCVPILEEVSGLTLGRDFHVGYSPERINPGDKEHRLETITKVVSGSDPEALDRVADIYSSIIIAGIHRAPSIKVAEAAKVIENTQRDLNISLMNELAILFGKMNIDTLDVLEASGTKWNFLNFRPGLVGGHCIGVDPYYLTHKAQMMGFHPEVILAGRRINDGMGRYIVDRLVLALSKKGKATTNSRCLVLGLSFKENCPDFRNTGVSRVLSSLTEYNFDFSVCDPWVDPVDAKIEFGLQLENIDQVNGIDYDSVLLLVSHSQFEELGPRLKRENPNLLILDAKGLLPRDLVDVRI